MNTYTDKSVIRNIFDDLDCLTIDLREFVLYNKDAHINFDNTKEKYFNISNISVVEEDLLMFYLTVIKLDNNNRKVTKRVVIYMDDFIKFHKKNHNNRYNKNELSK